MSQLGCFYNISFYYFVNTYVVVVRTVVVLCLNGSLMIRGIIRNKDNMILRARNWQEFKDIEVTTNDRIHVFGVVVSAIQPMKKVGSIAYRWDGTLRLNFCMGFSIMLISKTTAGEEAGKSSCGPCRLSL